MGVISDGQHHRRGGPGAKASGGKTRNNQTRQMLYECACIVASPVAGGRAAVAEKKYTKGRATAQGERVVNGKRRMEQGSTASKQRAHETDPSVAARTTDNQRERERTKKKTKPATFAAHKGARGKRGATDATPTPAQTRLHRCGRRGPVLSRTQWILTRGPRRGAAPQHAPPAGGAWAAAGGRRGPRPIGLKQLIDDVIRARPPPAVAGTRARARARARRVRRGTPPSVPPPPAVGPRRARRRP